MIPANGEVQTHEEATLYVKELYIFLTMKDIENTPAVFWLGKFCDENGYCYEWISGQQPHLIKNRIRIQCNTENFVPSVVLCLSSSSSGSHPSTSMTPSREESNHPTSSSSSSTLPTTTVASDCETRKREDLSGMDSHPVPLSSQNVEEMIERGDRLYSAKPTKNPKTNQEETKIEKGNPLCAEILERLQELMENMVDHDIPETGDSHASSSHEPSLEHHTQEK